MNRVPKNHLLGFLRARPRPVGTSFRTNPRLVSNRRGRLSWRVGEETRTIPVRLIDISRGGAAVSATNPPPVNVLVRLRLVGSSPTPWIEADVLEVASNETGHRIRLKFRDPCPNVMLKSAVLEAGSRSLQEATPHTKRRSQDPEATA